MISLLAAYLFSMTDHEMINLYRKWMTTTVNNDINNNNNNDIKFRYTSINGRVGQ